MREALKLKGLNTTGNKQELIDRLQAASSEEGTIDPNIEDELLNDVSNKNSSSFSDSS